MKKVLGILLFASALFAPVMAHAVDETDPLARLTRCQVDDDCIVVEQICPYTWIAINKIFRVNHQEFLQRTRKVIECPSGDPTLTAPEKAICVEERCEFQEEKKSEKAPEQTP